MDKILSTLKSIGQDHLIEQLNSIHGQDREALINDIESLDFKLLRELIGSLSSLDRAMKTSSINGVPSTSESPSDCNEVQPHPFRRNSTYKNTEITRWKALGEEHLRSSKVGVLLVAGGQGSRLGYDGPKGAFQLGLKSESSLFQLHAERVLSLSNKFETQIPWAIMTSPQNHEETLEHFESNQYFGLQEEQVSFFKQGVLPAVSLDGKILLASPNRLQTAPDGNGGCFKAFQQSGILDAWKSQGIEDLFIFSVDNCLARPADPTFIGFYKASEKLSASTVVRKAYPEERVGIFALKNNLPTVIEYSELNEDQIQATDSKGQLSYDGGNMAIHLISLDVLTEAAQAPLPYHKAIKKISFWNGLTTEVPQVPNACKFEQFMFDIFPRCKSMALLEVERKEWFAPIKNATGQDSPESARKLLHSLHKSWLQRSCQKELEGNYEISPILSYAGEGLPNSIDEIKLHPKIFSS